MSSPGDTAKRILVVDDEECMRILVTRMLGREGYTVSCVASGHQALRVFENAHAEGRCSPFDLAVIDMVMPDNFDGSSTLTAIRAIYPELRAIMISGYPFNDVETSGATKYMTKPFPTRDLLQTVKSFLQDVAPPERHDTCPLAMWRVHPAPGAEPSQPLVRSQTKQEELVR